MIAAFFTGTAVLHHGVPHPSFGSDPAVTRAVLTTGAYLALTGLIGLGVGALIWHSGAAIAVTVGGLFAVPLIFAAAGRGFARVMPELIAGNSLAAVKPVPGFTWSPWLELAMVAVYPAVLLAAGCWRAGTCDRADRRPGRWPARRRLRAGGRRGTLDIITE